MCVMSMVYAHYQSIFPTSITSPIPSISGTLPLFPQVAPDYQIIPNEEIAALKKLINDFKEAVAAAKIVDNLTGQKDCVDVEKQKLEDRVALLEQQIAELKDKK
jgi:hypothetical protein